MKIISEVKKIREGVYVFETPLDIEEGKYTLSISKYRNSRSLNQNALLWELITEIVKKENGGRSTEQLRLDLYTSLLEMAGAVSIYCEIEPKDIQQFQKSYRAVKIIGVNESNDKIKAIAYIGSSQFNTKQMADLIDVTLDYASEVGLYTPYWEDLLKHE